MDSDEGGVDDYTKLLIGFQMHDDSHHGSVENDLIGLVGLTEDLDGGCFLLREVAAIIQRELGEASQQCGGKLFGIIEKIV